MSVLGRGDNGFTDVPKLGRVRKSHPLLEAYGTVDELMSILGYAEAVVEYFEFKELLHRIQEHLFTLNSNLALGDANRFPLSNHLKELDNLITKYEAELPELRRFIYPSGSPAAAILHVCRSVSRRAERVVTKLIESQTVDPAVPAYLNRLSTLLFTLSRIANKRAGLQDREWVTPHRQPDHV
ncbi:MAG: cob(I)yrinic acid a,c-diamide adenosyltransferase [Nitrososphaerota archaeon]